MRSREQQGAAGSSGELAGVHSKTFEPCRADVDTGV